MKLRYFYNYFDPDPDNRDYLFWIWRGGSKPIELFFKDGDCRKSSVHKRIEKHWVEIAEEEAALLL